MGAWGILLNYNTLALTSTCFMLATLGLGTQYPETSLVLSNIRGQGEQTETVKLRSKFMGEVKKIKYSCTSEFLYYLITAKVSWARMNMTYPTMFKIAPYYIRAAVKEMITKQAQSLL